MTEYVTVAETAAMTGVNRHTVDRWVREGRLVRYKVPGRMSTRFKRADVEALAAPVAVGGPWPDAEDKLERKEGEPEGYHLRRSTEEGYPLMGSSDAERAESKERGERARQASMRDHPFVGSGPYCEDRGESSRSGQHGTITMWVECGWSREMHPTQEGAAGALATDRS